MLEAASSEAGTLESVNHHCYVATVSLVLRETSCVTMILFMILPHFWLLCGSLAGLPVEVFDLAVDPEHNKCGSDATLKANRWLSLVQYPQCLHFLVFDSCC